MLRLILKENFFHSNGKHYLQNHGTAIGTKTAVLIPLPIFFITCIETTTQAKLSLERQFGNATYTISFPYGKMSKSDIEAVFEQANLHHPTIEFTAKTFDTETAFLDTVVYKGTRFREKSILDAKTHFKQTETFLHTHFIWCHPPNVRKGFVKGQALRILRINSSETTFEENNSKLKKTLDGRRLPTTFDRKHTIRTHKLI